MVATSVPDTSCLLIVEPTVESLEALPLKIRSNTLARFEALDEAATLAKVPRYFATYEGNKQQQKQVVVAPMRKYTKESISLPANPGSVAK